MTTEPQNSKNVWPNHTRSTASHSINFAKDATMTESPAQQNQADINSLSYEQAREELVGIVKRLEAGNLPLEDSLSLWERGEALADRCQSWLDGARERLDKARDESSDDEG